MRDILFRGFHERENGTQKAFYNGEWHKGKWVYGYYVPCCLGHFPCVPCIVPEPDRTWKPIEVASETVCQYTGIDDKHSKKIFDGDVVKITNPYDKSISYYISFKPSCFVANQIGINFCTYLGEFYCGEYEIEIIGNKFENPELLEVEE